MDGDAYWEDLILNNVKSQHSWIEMTGIAELNDLFPAL